jgi:cyclopropane fatty-acyl-phospholipid synthase-like methyltransferase
MKLRVIRKSDNDFIPQWFDETKNQWKRVYLRDDFGMEYHETLDEAQRACFEFAEKKTNTIEEVVWEVDTRSW